MRERPILFSGPMVRAILDGQKTQTRRVVKPQPPAGARYTGIHYASDEPDSLFFNSPVGPSKARVIYEVGDRFWVREAWAVQRHEPCEPHERDYQELLGPTLRYLADGATRKIGGDRATGVGVYRGRVESGRPSIHMPRWASRILLEITDIRVERLTDCSEADALAEGAQHPSLVPIVGAGWSSRDMYARLWEHINGKDSWAANPWVWVVEFKQVDG